MKGNTTPQWLDFLSAPHRFPLTLHGRERAPPQEYYTGRKLKLRTCSSWWQEQNKKKKKKELYIIPIQMTDDSGSVCRTSKVTSLLLHVWRIWLLPQEELVSVSIRGHEIRGEKDLEENFVLIWPEQQFEINWVSKYHKTVDEETAQFVRYLYLTCRSNFIFLLLFQGEMLCFLLYLTYYADGVGKLWIFLKVQDFNLKSANQYFYVNDKSDDVISEVTIKHSVHLCGTF